MLDLIGAHDPSMARETNAELLSSLKSQQAIGLDPVLSLAAAVQFARSFAPTLNERGLRREAMRRGLKLQKVGRATLITLTQIKLILNGETTSCLAPTPAQNLSSGNPGATPANSFSSSGTKMDNGMSAQHLPMSLAQLKAYSRKSSKRHNKQPI
ncbi:MAG: hypothetical protein JNM81_06990 [Rhodospirillaceae bacterium]|nr:hypothetical protein [Rhodospirillaceae bacterium]